MLGSIMVLEMHYQRIIVFIAIVGSVPFVAGCNKKPLLVRRAVIPTATPSSSFPTPPPPSYPWDSHSPPPSASPSPYPTVLPSPTPSEVPSPSPTELPSPSPSVFPTPFPTPLPSPFSGTLDPTFGDNGVTFAFGPSRARANALAMQFDGKIIAAGYSLGTTYYSFAVARFNENGSLDSTFGTGGMVKTSITAYNALASAVAIQSDGKIVVAGSSSNGTYNTFGIARYNPNGTLDTTFNTDGKRESVFGDLGSVASALAVQSDGRILAVGETSSSASATGSDFAMARYNLDGSNDTSFGVGGKVTTDLGTIDDRAYDVVVQADGKILLAGQRGAGAFALVRYNPNGSLDNSFGASGIVTTTIKENNYAYAVALQADSKIVLAGWVGDLTNTVRSSALARYHTDGILDDSFGFGGTTTTTNAIGADPVRSVRAMKLQNDGKIIVAGSLFTAAGDFYIALARYLPNGAIDTGFGVGGLSTTVIGKTSVATCLAIQEDGKIIVGGIGIRAGSPETAFTLVRYLP